MKNIACFMQDYFSAWDMSTYRFSLLTNTNRMTATVSGLINAVNILEQINLFDQRTRKQVRQAKIEDTIDELRKRFGYKVIRRASAALDRSTQNLDVKRSNVVYPGRSPEIKQESTMVRKK